MRNTRLRPLPLFLAVLAICATTTAVAAPITWYVNVATGNDSNSGTSSGTPYKWITKAMSVALSGDTILVAPGTYYTLPSC